jgi:hypothetical protein
MALKELVSGSSEISLALEYKDAATDFCGKREVT